MPLVFDWLERVALLAFHIPADNGGMGETQVAYVLISADRVLAAGEAARNALKPKPNEFKGAWSRQEQTLNDIFSAATWTQNNPLAEKEVALSEEERSLLEPYLKP